MNHPVTSLRVSLAWLVGAALELSSSAHAQFEHVIPMDPVASYAVRAIVPLTVNPSASKAYLIASSAVPSGSVKPGQFQFLDSSGNLNISAGGAYLIPTGSGSWFDVHSVAETPSGGFVVTGRAFGGCGGCFIVGSAVVLLDANLDYVKSWEPNGADPNDPNMKALALPSGEIIQMVNGPLTPGRASAWLVFYPADLSSTPGIGWKEYTNANCDHLRFTDMYLSGDRYLLYIVGYKVDEVHPGANLPFLMEIDVDPSMPATYGQPLAMWVFPDGFPPGTTDSRFTAVTRDLSTGDIWAVGTFQDITQPFSILVPRAVSFVPSSGSKHVDVWYFPLIVVPAGGAFVEPSTICEGGAYFARLDLTGTDISGERGRHVRLDSFTGGVMNAREFGGGVPPYTRFNAAAPFTGAPNLMLMGGSYRANGAPATPYDLYIVKTSCNGATSCSIPLDMSPPNTIGTAVLTDTPVVTQSRFAIVGREFPQSNPIVLQATVMFHCPGCLGDITEDGVVSGADLGLLLGNWGAPGGGDVDGDGVVSGADLGLLLGSWGPCPS